YREAREHRRAKIDASYKYIFKVLSIRLELSLEAVEEMILDAYSFAAFESFFRKGGRKALQFFYQEGEAPGIECGRTIPGLVKGSKMMRLYVEKAPDKFVGLCLYFVRCNNDNPIHAKTIHQAVTALLCVIMQEILFGVLDATEGLLCGVKNMMEKFFLPAVRATNNWGALNQTKRVVKEKEKCVEAIEKFVSSLKEAIRNVEGTVELKKIDYIDFSKLQSFNDTTVAGNPAMIRQLEEVLMIWYGQIEQVLNQSKQEKKEDYDAGPLSELEHWKSVSAKISFIMEQIEGPNCTAVVKVLTVAQSKLLMMWQELCAKITDAVNESKDNVKYLRTLDQVCQPLYKCDVVSATHGVPCLINAIRRIHDVSRYYNTSERMTLLFMKVTNQMVTTCRAYITDSGSSCVWDQESSTVIGKIKDCMCLLEEYQKCFQETKQEVLETGREKIFVISEMAIFGKSKAFCRRLDKITEIITIAQKFDVLSQSAIEEADIMAVKFKNIYQTLVREKQYDVLDPREPEFDVDFADFMAQIKDLEMQIQALMRTRFERIPSWHHAFQLLKRFQKPGMDCLQEETECTFGHMLQCYVAELEATVQLYETQKRDPPLARNMPVVAGKIEWAKHLFVRIREPISYFQKNSSILASPKGKEAFKSYNRLAYVLEKFEACIHEAWKKAMSQVQYPLEDAILVQHPETGKLLVNFCAQIPWVVRETKCMMRLGLEVPEQAIKILKVENDLKSNKSCLEGLLQHYEDLCQKTPVIFANLMQPKRIKMDAVLRQGLTMLMWSSVTLPSFFQEADQVLNEYQQFLKEVTDIRDMRIDLILKEISSTLLIVLPVDGPTKTEEMLTCNETHTKKCADLLNHRSMQIEDAVQELLSVFKKNYEKCVLPVTVEKKHSQLENEEERKNSASAVPQGDPHKGIDKEDEFEKESKELVGYFSQQLLGSLQEATFLSLHSLKKRVHISRSVHPRKSEEVASLLQGEVHLAVPNVVMVPSLDDIQQAIRSVAQLILEVSRGVSQWGQERRLQKSILKAESGAQQVSSVGFQSPGKTGKKWQNVKKLRNFYSSVAKHEGIFNLVQVISSSMNSVRELASEVLQGFEKYRALWTEDKDAKIQQFLDTCSSLSDIKEELLRYAMLEQEIEDMNPIILAGPLELHIKPLQKALATEAKAWKHLLCCYLHEEYKKKMTDVTSFISGYLKKLSRPLHNLSDVRFAKEALTVVHESDIEMDMIVGPIE
ncbi:DYH8 protein, partial [Rhinopomastus cyanomelas]|nr:DYH8 protein [Rhinopomastus cyanomelas]